jgi:hypothetical protein
MSFKVTFELDAELLGDRAAAREDGDVLAGPRRSRSRAPSVHTGVPRILVRRASRRLALDLFRDGGTACHARHLSTGRVFIDEIFFS